MTCFYDDNDVTDDDIDDDNDDDDIDDNDDIDVPGGFLTYSMMDGY